MESTVPSEKDYLIIRFNWYRAIIVALVVFTIVTRFWGLADKPFHHDESLYATYSWYLYEGRGYKYDPMMHGPLMFHLNALVFTLFGPGDFTARLTAALSGLALVCCAFLLKRQLGKIGVLASATLFCVSPVYMYFSRFLRHDIYFALWAFLVVAFYMRFVTTGRRRFVYGCATALTFMFCVKENSYMTLFIFVSFLLFMRIFEKAAGISPSLRAAGPPRGTARRLRLLDLIVSAALFLCIFYLLYTTFLSNPRGFIDGLYRKSLGYWIYQDKIQRIRGPFTYFCPIAVTYELPTLVVVMAGLIGLLKRGRVTRIVLAVSSAVALPLMIFWLLNPRGLPSEPWDTRFHMTSPLHVVFALYVFTLGLAATCRYLKEERRFPAFLAYWSFTSLLLYSYAGEKVPWLFMHALMPMILWAGLLLDEFFSSESFKRASTLYVAMMLIGLFLYLQASIRLCFFNEADPRERMVYTQTSEEVKKTLDTISRLAEKTGKGLDLPIGVQGDSTWPYTWYLRDYRKWFHPGPFTSPREAVVIVDWRKRGDYRNILEPNYIEKMVKLREWWVPEPLSKLKNIPAAWLRYFFRREPWSITGSQDIGFYVRRDIAGEEAGRKAEKPLEEVAAGRPTPRIPPSYKTVGPVPPLLVFGSRGSAPGRLNEPRGIWVDGGGGIYVADTKNHRWQKFNKKGKCLLSVGKEGSGIAEFKEPMGIAVDEEGNVYVADTWNHRIQKFDSEGRYLSQWSGGAGGFWAPKGLAFDRRGYLYVVDTGKHRVQKFTREGRFLLVWGDRGDLPGQFSEPVGIAIARDGLIRPAEKEKGVKELRGDVIYVADTANRRVQKFDTSGRFLGQFGVLGWEEYYTEPFIGLDREGRIWLTDSRNNRIEIFSPGGVLVGLWSAKGFRPGEFNIPIGIFIRDGRVYISDTYNFRIQEFAEDKVF